MRGVQERTARVARSVAVALGGRTIRGRYWSSSAPRLSSGGRATNNPISFNAIELRGFRSQKRVERARR